MLTITEIKAQIYELQANAPNIRAKQQAAPKEKKKSFERQLNQARSRIAYLNQIVLYLQSGPTGEFCEKELLRLTDKIKLFDASFETWKKQYIQPKPMNDMDLRAIYRKSVNYSGVMGQIDNLKFILEK